MKFTRKTTYYPFPVHEFNLPAGHTCPFAGVCKVVVNRETGKMDRQGKGFRCYASASERFPAVREARWDNLDALRAGEPITLPPKAAHVRVHGSGDFFSQAYFDEWLQVARDNPGVHFWAFTKSIRFWIARLGVVPPNFVLTASYGGIEDHLIDEYGLRSARVYSRLCEVPDGMQVDVDDSLAMVPGPSFALLDNFAR